MADPIAEFRSIFRGHPGETAGEKKRNFQRLLHQNTDLQQNENLLVAISQQLTPTTPLERTFQVDFYIHFHRFKELSELYLQGDNITTRKLCKQPWFFREFFKEIRADFVHEVLPTLSVGLRLRILNKLAENVTEVQCDEIFDALHSRYGIFTATHIITGCSSNKIQHLMENYPLKISESQLMRLYRKNPALIPLYFDEWQKSKGANAKTYGPSFFSFIAKNHPELFCQLHEKHKIIQWRFLGKRTTKKLVEQQKERIMAQPHLYGKNVHPQRFVRKMGLDFKKFYVKIFPKTIQEALQLYSYTDCQRLFDQYAKNGQYNLFKDTFNQTFHKKLEDNIEQINDNLLKLIVDGEERERLARRKVEELQDESYYKFYKAENCLKVVETKLKFANNLNDRMQIMAMLTYSCLLEKNWQILSKCLEMLCTRFKSDNVSLHAHILDYFVPQNYWAPMPKFKAKDLNAGHWKQIKEILSRHDLHEALYDLARIYCRFFEFLVRNQLPIREEIENLHALKNLYTFDFQKLDSCESEMRKQFLLELIELAPKLMKSDCIDRFYLLVIDACKNYNKKYPEVQIDVNGNPRVRESVKNVLRRGEKIDDNLLTAVEYVIMKSVDVEDFEELSRLYWENSGKFATETGVWWFWKHKPEEVVKYFDKFLATTVINRRICSKLKTYPALKQQAVDFYISKLEDENFKNSASVTQALTSLMSGEDFLKLLEKFKPSSTKVDFTDKQQKRTFELQRQLLKALKNLDCVEIMLPVILQFSREDYLASTLSALYSGLYRIPENRIRVFLDNLCNQGAVSVKKHGFFFSCIVLDRSTVLNVLSACKLTQAISMSFKYFVKNPDESSWAVFKQKLPLCDKNDRDTALVLVNTTVPHQYQVEFFEMTFEVFHKQNNKFKNVLVNCINRDTLGRLNEAFLVKINDEFLEIEKMDIVFSHYLIFSESGEKMQVVFQALKSFKEKKWALNKSEHRKKLQKFIKTFFEIYMESEVTNVNLIENFLLGFEQIFKPIEIFDEFVILYMMKFKKLPLDSLSKAVVELNNRLIGQYGQLTVELFAKVLKKLLKKFFENDSDQDEFYNLLLKSKQSINDVMLVIKLFPKAEPQLVVSVKFYHNTLMMLRQIDDEVVHLHLNLFLNEIE